MPNNIEQIQELTRILDATLSIVNHQGLPTGQNAKRIIEFIAKFPGMETFVGENFSELMETELKNSEIKENVREHIKKIWMYPKYEYDPWTKVEN